MVIAHTCKKREVNSMKDQEYLKYVQARAKRSPTFKNCIFAFLIGGLICSIGQAFRDIYTALSLNEQDVGTLTSVTLIFITAVLTGLGVFDNIAKKAGAGTLVPITGFANEVCSQSIDSKSEGFVLGVGAKIFSVAGPVIVFGILSGTIYGVIYYLCTLIWG